MMNKTITVSILALSLALTACGEKGGSDASAGDAKDAASSKVVATVNGSELTEKDLNGVLKMTRAGQNPDIKAKERALDDLIMLELSRQAAEKDNIDDSDEFERRIADVKKRLMIDIWAKQKMESFAVSDADLKAAYDKEVGGRGGKEYKARHILVKTEKEAKAIIKQLGASGKNFESLAKSKSIGPSKKNGGDLGWFAPDRMVKPFSEAVAKMKKGTVTQVPVKTNFGYHVIKLEDMRDKKLPTLESMKKGLKRKLSVKQMKAEMDKLKSEAKIEKMLK